MIIAIDFDGTCVTHEFPKVGKDIGSVPVLKKLIKNGHKLVLFTMRSDLEEVSSGDYNINSKSGKYLSEALKWFEDNKIPLYGINNNPDQKTWTSSPKAYAELYIDDLALGCPIIYNPIYSEKPYVDWKTVEDWLIESKIIKE